MIKRFFYKVILRNFFSIELNSLEKEVAIESVEIKYAKATSESLLYVLLIFPTLLLFDTSTLVNILIPITMVSGSAWFSISLTSVKKKFEKFGLELTVDMYRAFVTSLLLLGSITIVSLNTAYLLYIREFLQNIPYFSIIASSMGILVILKVIYDIFSGATKYDLNDSMLAGQNEAAEQFYKKALSLLSTCAEFLKKDTPVDVTNYYVGLAFHEVFSYVLKIKGDTPEIRILLSETSDFRADPPKSTDKSKEKIIFFIEKIIDLITNLEDSNTKKSLGNINVELSSIRGNKESDMLVNTRLSVVLEEIENLLTTQGEALFVRRLEIEKKYIVPKVSFNLSKYKHFDIKQGYLDISPSNEIRVRSLDDKYILTTKKMYPSGFREEIEKYITHKEFDAKYKLTVGKRIEKKRYQIPYSGLIIELDIFEGKNNGLLLAEVEFDSMDKAKDFKAPSWFGEDVTNDKSYKNANLAK